MPPAAGTGTAILILTAFLLPGFVALVYAERTYRTRSDDGGFDRLLITLYYSALTYAGLVVGFLLLGLDSDDVRAFYKGRKSLESYAVFALAALLLSLAIAELGRRWFWSSTRSRLLRRMDLSPVHQTPSGWEHFFLTDTTAMVRVTLDDGRVLGGYFGPKSFAGYTADTPDLYLEQRWSWTRTHGSARRRLERSGCISAPTRSSLWSSPRSFRSPQGATVTRGRITSMASRTNTAAKPVRKWGGISPSQNGAKAPTTPPAKPSDARATASPPKANGKR